MKKISILTTLLLFVLTVQAQTVIKGDANNDKVVSLLDVIETSNAILGKPSANYNATNADFNGDGHVNAADIVGILNMIIADKPAALTKADLIGTWEVKAQEESGENSFSYSFTEDNLTVEQQGDVLFTAPYTFEDGILTYTVPATEWSEAYTETRNVSMLYDKSVLVLKYQETIEMMDENMEPVETTVDQAEVYINKVKQPDTSGAKLDGKWFCYHRGDEAEVRSGLWIDGDKAEFVIGAWATRMVGPYTYENGVLTLHPTEYYFGRDPDDWGYGRIDPATLECSSWDRVSTNPGLIEELTGGGGAYPETFVFFVNGDEAYGWYANLPCLYHKQ